ncbi:MAG TPA: hypothetical protein VFE33_10235 [Thermoanaerobaculia bacterium]|nr:hypothetical protein [Thermoanaerobaculia bacterium]
MARRKGERFKEVSRPSKFRVTPKACGFRPGVDVLHLNRLNDELEMEDFQRKLTGAGRE